jgi:outer membrane protein
MKKIGVLVILLFSMGFSFAQSFVHVDSQRILDTMPSRKKAMDELANFETRAMKEMEEAQNKFNLEYTDFQNNANTMSATARRFEEDRLNKKYQEMQARGQELDQQMNILANDLNAPILERVQKAIENVAKTEKLDYVLDKTVLLFSNGKDLTDKVIIEVMKLENSAE